MSISKLLSFVFRFFKVIKTESSAPVLESLKKSEFGRFQLVPVEGDAFSLEIENLYRDGDFWVKIMALDEEHFGVLGFLKFTSVSSGFFQLTDMRPAGCPIPASATQTLKSSCPQPEGSSKMQECCSFYRPVSQRNF